MSNLTSSLLIFLITIFILLHYKPKRLFNGNVPKRFGIGIDQTMFPISVIGLFSGIISYLVLSFKNY